MGGWGVVCGMMHSTPPVDADTHTHKTYSKQLHPPLPPPEQQQLKQLLKQQQPGWGPGGGDVGGICQQLPRARPGPPGLSPTSPPHGAVVVVVGVVAVSVLWVCVFGILGGCVVFCLVWLGLVSLRVQSVCNSPPQSFPRVNNNKHHPSTHTHTHTPHTHTHTHTQVRRRRPQTNDNHTTTTTATKGGARRGGRKPAPAAAASAAPARVRRLHLPGLARLPDRTAPLRLRRACVAAVWSSRVGWGGVCDRRLRFLFDVRAWWCLV